MTPKRAALLIRLIGWGFIIFSTVFVTIAFKGFDGFAHYVADFIDWTGPAHDEPLSRDARWFGAIFSGLGAGFGAFYVFLVAPLLTVPNLDAQNLAKHGGILAAVIWFVVDSAGSVASGVPSNAVFNFAYFLWIVIPLGLVKFEVQRA